MSPLIYFGAVCDHHNHRPVLISPQVREKRRAEQAILDTCLTTADDAGNTESYRCQKRIQIWNPVTVYCGLDPLPGVVNGTGHEGAILCEIILQLESYLGCEPGVWCACFLDILDICVNLWNQRGPFPSVASRAKYMYNMQELLHRGSLISAP
jgi:hypothetical protein